MDCRKTYNAGVGFAAVDTLTAVSAEDLHDAGEKAVAAHLRAHVVAGGWHVVGVVAAIRVVATSSKLMSGGICRGRHGGGHGSQEDGGELRELHVGLVLQDLRQRLVRSVVVRKDGRSWMVLCRVDVE